MEAFIKSLLHRIRYVPVFFTNGLSYNHLEQEPSKVQESKVAILPRAEALVLTFIFRNVI